MLSRLLFGDDIFISYSRKDGATYAVGLAAELTDRGLSCFIDQLEASPDVKVPASLKSRLRNCTALVLVATPRALESEPVRVEVEEFKKTGRSIIPVYFNDDDPARSPLHALVPGLAVTRESADALATGDPSDAVVSRVEKSFNYARRNAKLRRVALGTVAAVVLLVGAAAAVSYSLVQSARRQADVLVKAAQAQKEGAESRANDARMQMSAALAKADEAEKLMKEAQLTRKYAEQKEAYATALLARARAGQR